MNPKNFLIQIFYSPDQPPERFDRRQTNKVTAARYAADVLETFLFSDVPVVYAVVWDVTDEDATLVDVLIPDQADTNNRWVIRSSLTGNLVEPSDFSEDESADNLQHFTRAMWAKARKDY